MALMAKILLLLILVAITLTAEAAPDEYFEFPDEYSAKMQKAYDAVMAAAPPGKDSEAAKAAAMELKWQTIIALAKAEKTGGKEKVASLQGSYEKAADLVIAAPPADKLKVMKKEYTAITDAA